ncbi:MAG: hypothetical protein WBP45_01500 [Daejeonella sp.]
MKRNPTHSGALQQRNGITKTPKTLRLLLLISIVLIASCKKDKTPAGNKYTYENSRIKQLNRNGVKYKEYFYNDKNQLTSSKDHSNSKNTVYEYNADGIVKKLTITDPTNQPNISDYSYNNEVLQFYTDGGGNKHVYTYTNNKLTKIDFKTPGGVLLSTITYEYSLSNGNPKVVQTSKNPDGSIISTYILIYSPDITDPDPLNLPGIPVLSNFVLQSFENADNLSIKSHIKYTIDSNGKIASYTETYSNNSPEENDTYTYIYEAKQ